MDSNQTLGMLLNVFALVLVVLLIVWVLYSLYYMNNNEKTEKVLLFFRKPRMGHRNKKRCPCGGHDPRSCRCRH